MNVSAAEIRCFTFMLFNGKKKDAKLAVKNVISLIASIVVT